MKKSFKYGFITCTLAYLLYYAAILIVEIFYSRGLSAQPLIYLPSLVIAMTLCLSSSPWAPLVPWLASSCVLALLINRFNGGARRRALLSGFSVFIYYFAMWLVFIIHGLIYGWGDIAYFLIWLWPLFGFGFGYAAATIVERILKPQVVD